MLDIKFIRENPDIVKKAVVDKNFDVDVDRILYLDALLKRTQQELEVLRHDRNKLVDEIKAGADAKVVGEQVKVLKISIAEKEKVIADFKPEYNDLLLRVPSIPLPEVPFGVDDNDNVELRRVGEIPKFDFKMLDHIELCNKLDLVDFPRAVKVAGTQSYYLKNEGMLLDQSICRFVLDFLVDKGFTPMSVPVMVREAAMQGTGYFPIGYEQAYSIPKDNLFLIGTSEVSLVSYNRDEILPIESLPIKYTGYSPCFRREAGTANRDKGLYRVHQFQKVEQVVICENDLEKAKQLHEEILKNVEEIMQLLELPYRVCLACTGEIGIGQIKKYEVEAWMPSRNAYSETHSCSMMGDFQARRLNIKYKDKDGIVRYVQTLNNTGIASPRILIPILENNQQPDGSVKIPKVLVPYMNGREYIYPKKNNYD